MSERIRAFLISLYGVWLLAVGVWFYRFSGLALGEAVLLDIVFSFGPLVAFAAVYGLISEIKDTGYLTTKTEL